jgi:hypothetical protein
VVIVLPKKPRKVYVPNRSVHDFSPAESYGQLIYLTEGKLDPYATSKYHRIFSEAMKDSDPEDYILLTGLNAVNVVAAHIMTKLHGRVNLLLFKSRIGYENCYVERIIL